MSHIFYTWQKLSFYILYLWENLAESDWCCFVCEFLSNQDGSWPAHTNARPASAPPPSSTWWGSPTSPSGTGWTLSRSCGVTRWPPGQGSKSFIRLNRTKLSKCSDGSYTTSTMLREHLAQSSSDGGATFVVRVKFHCDVWLSDCRREPIPPVWFLVSVCPPSPGISSHQPRKLR